MLPEGRDTFRKKGGLRIVLPTGIFPPDIGGPASYVPRIASVLKERGHALQVITLADDPNAGGEHPFPVNRIRRGMARIPRMIRTVSAVAAAARKADLIFANGLFIEAAVAAALARKPLAMKIVGDWAWERARNRSGKGETVEAFQSRPQGLRWEAVKRLRTSVTRRADRIITPSRYLAGIVAAWGIPEDRTVVVYNALEPAPEIQTADIEPFAGRTLITVARLVCWKGIDALLELAARREDRRILIVGDGPERFPLETLAARLGLGRRAVFTGAVSRGRVMACMKTSDVFILNSLYEGLPHIVLEAFAAGIPVVATDAGGMREVVADGVNGLLVPVRRKDLLSAAVERILADDGLRKKLIAGGRRTLSRFRWETMVDETESVLRRTAAGEGDGG